MGRREEARVEDGGEGDVWGGRGFPGVLFQVRSERTEIGIGVII